MLTNSFGQLFQMNGNSNCNIIADFFVGAFDLKDSF